MPPQNTTERKIDEQHRRVSIVNLASLDSRIAGPWCGADRVSHPLQDKPWLQTVGDLPLPGIDKNMEKFGQEMGCESGKAAILAPIQMISLEHQRQEHSNSAAASQADAEYGEEDITIYPRSARSGGCDGPKSPVRITRDILTENFNMPLHAAADHMGICITALKKVCRKFGIQKWPYRDSMLQGAKLDVDAPALHHHIAKAKVPRSALASLADAACSSADSEERSSSHDESEACEGKCSIAALLMASESILGQSVLG
jgi:hypothetical protein